MTEALVRIGHDGPFWLSVVVNLDLAVFLAVAAVIRRERG